jgi:hypothetical protein
MEMVFVSKPKLMTCVRNSAISGMIPKTRVQEEVNRGILQYVSGFLGAAKPR